MVGKRWALGSGCSGRASWSMWTLKSPRTSEQKLAHLRASDLTTFPSLPSFAGEPGLSPAALRSKEAGVCGAGQGSYDRCGAPGVLGWLGRVWLFRSVGAHTCAFLQSGGVATSVA